MSVVPFEKDPAAWDDQRVIKIGPEGVEIFKIKSLCKFLFEEWEFARCKHQIPN